MAKFRKKPVIIEAVQFNPEALPTRELTALPEGVRPTSYTEVANMLSTAGCSKEAPFWNWMVMATLQTLEGTLVVSPGDWIITGVKGERYPCKPDIFEATYELERMTNHRVRPDAGWVAPHERPRGPNGRALCRWCNTEVPRGPDLGDGGPRLLVARRLRLPSAGGMLHCPIPGHRRGLRAVGEVSDEGGYDAC